MLLLKTDGGNAWMEASRITAFQRGFHSAAAATSGEHSGRGLTRDEQTEANQTRCCCCWGSSFSLAFCIGLAEVFATVREQWGLGFPTSYPALPLPAKCASCRTAMEGVQKQQDDIPTQSYVSERGNTPPEVTPRVPTEAPDKVPPGSPPVSMAVSMAWVPWSALLSL
jgi:hypothetical protein